MQNPVECVLRQKLSDTFANAWRGCDATLQVACLDVGHATPWLTPDELERVEAMTVQLRTVRTLLGNLVSQLNAETVRRAENRARKFNRRTGE